VKGRFNCGAAGLRDMDMYQFALSVYWHIDDSRPLTARLFIMQETIRFNIRRSTRTSRNPVSAIP